MHLSDAIPAKLQGSGRTIGTVGWQTTVEATNSRNTIEDNIKSECSAILLRLSRRTAIPYHVITSLRHSYITVITIKPRWYPPPPPSDSPNETTRPDSLEQSGLPRLMRIKKGTRGKECTRSVLAILLHSYHQLVWRSRPFQKN